MAWQPPPGGMPPPGGPPGAAHGYPPPGGYGYPPQQQAGYPPPPQQDPLLGYFQHVAGADGQISAEELQRCLTESGMSSYPRPGGQFNLETCRLMIAMLDRDFSGSMGFDEFKELWGVLEHWKGTFQRYDRDRSGSIEAGELHGAIRDFGYNLSPQAIHVITKRYSKRSDGQIHFDDFVACSIRLRSMSEAFRRRDASGQGMAMLAYDDFIQMTMAV